MNWHAKPLTQREIKVSQVSVYPWGAIHRAGAGVPLIIFPLKCSSPLPQALLTDFQRIHSALGRLGQGLAFVAPCWGWNRTPRGIDGGATEHVRSCSVLLGDPARASPELFRQLANPSRD